MAMYGRTLGEAWRASRRENGGNALGLARFSAAVLVLAGHSLMFSGIKTPLTDIGLMMFFAVAGFLAAQSWKRNPDIGSYAFRRARRLLPAIWVLVLVLALVIGPTLSNYSYTEYFSDFRLMGFLLNLLLLPVYQDLPGVLGQAPLAYPLMALFHGLICYVVIAIFGSARALTGKICLVMMAVLFAVTALGLEEEIGGYYFAGFFTLGPSFFAGAFAALEGERIRLNAQLSFVFVLTLGVAAFFHATTQWFALFGVYVLFYLTFTPRRKIPAWLSLGRYAYGVYLWGWPAQLLTAAAYGIANPMMNFAIALPMAVMAAMLSWSLVEAPFQRLRAVKSPSSSELTINL